MFTLHLKSIRKLGSIGASSRVRSVKDTLHEIIPLCAKIGVTRLSNITYMDKLNIPNYSAILPATEDLFWVYSGKGPTKAHAMVSALMEAIERYSSLPSSYPRSIIKGSYSELSNSYNKVVHPDELVELVNPEFKGEDDIIDFLPGFDLLTQQEVLVPAEVALYRYFPKRPATHVFSHSHTNGLASGNVLEEAICHALCEVIERDAISIADLCSSSIPYTILKKIMDSLEDCGGYSTSTISIEDKFVDDPGIFPDVDISNIAEDFRPIKYLVKRFTDAGIPLLIKNITQKDIGVATFVASTIEWITHDYGYFAKGYGTHPDSRIALIRAITEAAQTRAANIQGARDDLRKIPYKENDDIYKRKWQFMSATTIPSMSNNSKTIGFSEIETFLNEDILDDIDLILYRLKSAGLKSAIIVDLTNPDIGIPVVRAIIPGLETFEVTNSIMGKRAKECFRRLHYG